MKSFINCAHERAYTQHYELNHKDLFLVMDMVIKQFDDKNIEYDILSLRHLTSETPLPRPNPIYYYTYLNVRLVEEPRPMRKDLVNVIQVSQLLRDT
jgi:hypothetical protein